MRRINRLLNESVFQITLFDGPTNHEVHKWKILVKHVLVAETIVILLLRLIL